VAAAQVDCRRAARADVERGFVERGTVGAAPSSTQPHDISGSWTSMMDRFSAEKRERLVFERCMTQQGFRFVPFTS
jgi:hypothetical protein